MPIANNKCPDCRGFLVRDGRCQVCGGSGRNPRLNSDELICCGCGGSGLCPTCRGTGLKNEIGPDSSGRSQRQAYLANGILFMVFAFVFAHQWFWRVPILAVAAYCLVRGATWGRTAHWRLSGIWRRGPYWRQILRLAEPCNSRLASQPSPVCQPDFLVLPVADLMGAGGRIRKSRRGAGGTDETVPKL
jgi:hypothetical protein